MEKRFIVAIVLVFLILFLWPLIFGRRNQPPASRKSEKELPEAPQIEEPAEELAEPLEPELEDFPEISEETIIPVNTRLYEVQLTTNGAQVVSWKLRDYFSRAEKSEDVQEYIDLVPQAPIRHSDRNWLNMKFLEPELQDEMEDAQWTPDKDSVSMDTPGQKQNSIEFDYSTSSEMRILKKLTFFEDEYFVDVDVEFHNLSAEDRKIEGYRLCWGPGISKDEILADMELANEGPVALLETESKVTKHWDRTGFACFGGKHVQVPEQRGPISWVGLSSKYFVALLIPGPDPWWSDVNNDEKRYVVSTEVGDTVLPAALPPKDVWNEWGRNTTVALAWPEFSIPAGNKAKHQYRIYVGPKKWGILRNVEGRDGSKERMSKLLSFGMFSPLGKATLWLLNVFYRVSKNYGVAIIFLTVLIKILYLPLTQKSFKSMKKMQDLAPKISVLKDRYRDDPQRLQKETMRVYKQHGASPMGGCLPLLFQMPVFWALFSTLRGAVELRGAMFISGWVTDLSLPDTVASVAGFPIRILPILMTGSMLAQQFLFGSGGQAQSNKMMAFMPLIFAFIFYGMPSGLVLYWLCNNILAIGHQYIIRRQDVNIEEQEEDEDSGKRTRTKRKVK